MSAEQHRSSLITHHSSLTSAEQPAGEVEVQEQGQHVRECEGDRAGGDLRVAAHHAQEVRHGKTHEGGTDDASRDAAQDGDGYPRLLNPHQGNEADQ